ncbi:MAG: hypothetical protein O2782_03690, partial [bacterium]|nr:hypothetical protein [bacterium]
RVHPEAAKSETEEFIEGYRRALIRVQGVNTWTHEPWEIARDVFHPELERRWAKAKMERIADMFEYPRMFLLDRDIIHGVALDLALRQGHNIEPVSFADALHDYRDAQRFDPRPLMTEFCKGIVTKPRAVFLTTVVDLGAAGLRGFFHAYRDNVMEAHDLIHALWSYLVSLSSDPAGVYSRVGKCRALCRPPGARIAGGRARPSENVAAPVGDLDRELAGILIRLDRRPDYRQKSREIVGLGDTAREELLAVITHHGLAETDEWATFKIKKQVIVSCACELLDEIDGGDRDTLAQLGDRRRVHEDEAIIKLLVDHPHRQTSDPSGVLLYARSYARTLATFGASDPDASFQLASVLVRLDLSDAYEALLARIPSLGPPAVSALYEVLDQVSERDERRRPILQRARQLLGSILLEKKQRSQASQRALRVSQGVPVSELSAGAADNDRGGVAAQVTPVDGFVSLYRELLTGTAFLQRGGLDGTQPAAADGEQANDEEHGSGAEV